MPTGKKRASLYFYKVVKYACIGKIVEFVRIVISFSKRESACILYKSHTIPVMHRANDYFIDETA